MVIERLFPEEFPFGEPEYSALSARAEQLREELSRLLDENGRKLLEELIETHLRMGNTGLRGAFREGVLTGGKLVREIVGSGAS